MGWFSGKSEVDEQGTKWDAYIGRKIKEAREEKGLTQSQLAEALYKSQGNISDYERGRLKINAVDVMLIASFLEKPVTIFFPPGVSGVTKGDLTDLEKELIHYSMQATEEMQLALIEQAKTYARISRKVMSERMQKIADDLPDVEPGAKRPKPKGKK